MMKTASQFRFNIKTVKAVCVGNYSPTVQSLASSETNSAPCTPKQQGELMLELSLQQEQN